MAPLIGVRPALGPPQFGFLGSVCGQPVSLTDGPLPAVVQKKELRPLCPTYQRVLDDSVLLRGQGLSLQRLSID